MIGMGGFRMSPIGVNQSVAPDRVGCLSNSKVISQPLPHRRDAIATMRATRAWIAAGLLLLSACSTQTVDQGSYYRTEQTQLSLQSSPSGSVNIDNRYVGVTPLLYPLQYEQEVVRSTKKVTLWDTQPGLAMFLTLISLGVYLPFSAIPVDSETTLEPQEVYRNNHFEITLQAPGYEQWKHELDLKGEKTQELQAQLVRKVEQ